MPTSIFSSRALPIQPTPIAQPPCLIVGIVEETSPIKIECADGISYSGVVAAGLSYGLTRGDTVLAVQLDSQCWILEVLHMADNPTRQYCLQSASSIRFMAERIELKTGVLQVEATGSVFRMGVVRISATSVTAVCQKIQTWTRNWFLRARVVATRANERITRVDAVDVLRGHEVDIQLTGTHNVKAQESHITARDNVSINGTKVLLG